MLKKFLLITLIMLATTSLASAVTQEIEIYSGWGFLADSQRIGINDLIKKRNQNGWRLVSITQNLAGEYPFDEPWLWYNYDLILLFEK